MSEDTFVYSELSTGNGYLQIGEYPHLDIVYDASTKILNITCIDSESNQACDKYITLIDFIKSLKIPVSDIARAYDPPSTVEAYIAAYDLQSHIDKAIELLPKYFDNPDPKLEILVSPESIGDHTLSMSIMTGIENVQEKLAQYDKFLDECGMNILDSCDWKLTFNPL